MTEKPTNAAANALRRRAEGYLRRRRTSGSRPRSSADSVRLLHELQVHQIELEMQNTELQEARDKMEVIVDKYTDLYDFAPTGYFSLDEQGVILDVNLTGAALLGAERTHLVNRRMQLFIAPPDRPAFQAFLSAVFTRRGKLVTEATLQQAPGTTFRAAFHAMRAIAPDRPQPWCRLAVADITELRRAQESQRRLETMTVANRELKEEIARRKTVEAALKKSEQHYSQLWEQSRCLQEQLRHLSHQLLSAQEDERRDISRELHDQVAQTLTGINVHLANLRNKSAVSARDLARQIGRTQRLVEQAVDIVHGFARRLRPTVLDDLGLIPALHALMKDMTRQTGLHIRFAAFADVERLNSAKRTALYRLTQSALTNVSQHACATLVKISIVKKAGTVLLEIHDNGHGFAVEHVWHSKRYKRLGLLGMRERAEMVGGRLTVESTPGHGTTIRAQIPFRTAGKRRQTP
ncbi:MAG: PAS domain S-box protein [Lentisphaerae bacterium]|nr:PAS domain S-box protein [Lentisphaerota bacterium]